MGSKAGTVARFAWFIAFVAAAVVGCSGDQGAGRQGSGGGGGGAGTRAPAGGTSGGAGGTLSRGGNSGGGGDGGTSSGGLAGTDAADAATTDGSSTVVVLEGCAGRGAEPMIPPAGNYGHPNGITAAGDDTCVVFPGGAVACWGADDAGQLGDCSTKPRPSPGMIAGISDVASFSMAAHRFCEVPIPAGSGSGPVICWGPGPPTSISGMPPANGVRVSDDHACATTAAGGNVYCWGDNTYGQLGDGTTNSSAAAVAVVGLSQVWINVGLDVTCAWNFQTTSWCWGRNADGQLGDGTTVSKSMPVRILPEPAVNPRPAGRRTFSYGNDNLFCSGTGVCGDGGGPSSVRLKPTQIALPSWPNTDPAGGDQTSCLVLGDGSVACWGSNNHGQLGDGTMVERFTPGPVLLPSGIQGNAIFATTDGSSFFLQTTNYTVYAWGRNDKGQLGDGARTDRSTPVRVMGIGNSVQLATGTSHACAMSTEWVIQCWGGNSSGQLGDGTFVDRATPVTVTF
jgi:alpha-tubulin suppressor-like RCC1 family protein